MWIVSLNTWSDYIQCISNAVIRQLLLSVRQTVHKLKAVWEKDTSGENRVWMWNLTYACHVWVHLHHNYTVSSTILMCHSHLRLKSCKKQTKQKQQKFAATICRYTEAFYNWFIARSQTHVSASVLFCLSAKLQLCERCFCASLIRAIQPLAHIIIFIAFTVGELVAKSRGYLHNEPDEPNLRAQTK